MNIQNVPSDIKKEDFSLNVLHQDQGVYHLYNEYINTIEDYVLNKTTSLSIRYYKTNIVKSKGVDTEIKLINNKRYGVTYDIFDIVQVVQLNPFTYSNEVDETNHVIRKTYGNLTVYGLVNPLPGDIFHFYPSETDLTEDDIEVFVVDNINFSKSGSGVKIYQIEFSTANIRGSSLSKLNIENHYYYLKEFKKFFDKDIYVDYKYLLENRDDYIQSINDKYNCINCTYSLDDTKVNDLIKDKINTIIYKLNDEYNLDFHPVLVDYNPDNYSNLDEYLNDFVDVNLINNLNDSDSLFLDNLSTIQAIYDRFNNYKIDEFLKIGSDVDDMNTSLYDLEKGILDA